MSDVIVALIGGSAGAAIIGGVFRLIEWAANRNAQKNDRAEAKAEKDRDQSDSINELKKAVSDLGDGINGIKQTTDNLTVAVKETLGDRLKYLCCKYIEQKEVRASDLRDLERMYDVYHDNLKGNGFYDSLMKEVRALHIKN